MVANGKIVLAGNNEDWRNPKTKIWFIPASNGEYGRVCVGFDDMSAQGGMNDQGLFIDANALSPTGWEPIGIFKLNVSEHPKSWNVYDSLGEAFMKQGEKELAIENYQKSLELNPSNQNGKNMLKKLGAKK